jgi:hypothetical protein
VQLVPGPNGGLVLQYVDNNNQPAGTIGILPIILGIAAVAVVSVAAAYAIAKYCDYLAAAHHDDAMKKISDNQTALIAAGKETPEQAVAQTAALTDLAKAAPPPAPSTDWGAVAKWIAIAAVAVAGVAALGMIFRVVEGFAPARRPRPLLPPARQPRPVYRPRQLRRRRTTRARHAARRKTARRASPRGVYVARDCARDLSPAEAKRQRLAIERDIKRRHREQARIEVAQLQERATRTTRDKREARRDADVVCKRGRADARILAKKERERLLELVRETREGLRRDARAECDEAQGRADERAHIAERARVELHKEKSHRRSMRRIERGLKQKETERRRRAPTRREAIEAIESRTDALIRELEERERRGAA